MCCKLWLEDPIGLVQVAELVVRPNVSQCTLNKEETILNAATCACALPLVLEVIDFNLSRKSGKKYE